MPKNPAWTRDELILALDLYIRSGPISSENPEVIELSETLRKLQAVLGIQDYARYRNANGVALELANFRALDPKMSGIGMSHIGRGNQLVWKEYHEKPEELHSVASAIRAGVKDKNHRLQPIDADSYEGAREGNLLLRYHRQFERNSQLIRRKKEQARLTGSLFCEICGFNPENSYKGLGDQAIECHHLLPLSQLVEARRTSLADLLLVCANCHRMLHAAPSGHSIEELRAVLFPELIPLEWSHLLG
jgi:5-methylcytosine-specific restriction enzyme A